MPRDLFAEQEEPRDLLVGISPEPEKPRGPFTPEEKESLKSDVLRFLWPGKEEAVRGLIKGTGTALGLGGAAAATAFAPSPLSPALGYAAGERAGKILEVLTGVSKPETPKESAIATGVDIGIGLLPYGIEKAAGIPSAVKGIVTRPWTQRGRVKELVKTVGGELEPSLAGKSAIEGVRQTYTKVSKQGNKLYENAKKLVPEDTKVGTSNLYSTIDNILKDTASSDAEKALANKFLKKISPEVRSGQRRLGLSPELQQEILARAEGELGISVRPLMVEEAYTIRSELSKEATRIGKSGWRAGQMLDALHQDLTETAGKIGRPEITKSFSDAINFWKNKVIPQREAVTFLEKKSVERIPDLLRTDIKTMEKIRQAMPEAEFQDLKRGLITDISTKAKNNPIQTGKDLRTLMAKKKEVMKSVFNNEELEAIRLSSEPGKLGKYFEEHPKTRWLVRFIGYGAAYSTLGYGALRHLFGFHM